MAKRNGLRRLTRFEKDQLEWICDASLGRASRLSLAKCILLLAAGHSLTATAEQLRVSRQTISHWRDRFNEGGLDALDDRAPTGRPRVFTEAQREQILSIAKTSPQQLGCPFEQWTLKQLTKYVNQVLCIRFSSAKVAMLLRDDGWTWDADQVLRQLSNDDTLNGGEDDARDGSSRSFLLNYYV